MANGENSSGGASPLWYSVAAIILILLGMAALVAHKPLDFTPPPAVHCDGAACEHEAAPPSGAPEGTSREAPAHGE